MLNHILLLLASSAVTEIRAIKTHFVYWNSTNPMFRIDNTDHIVDVNIGNLPWEYDQLNLICPNSREQHVIYSVSKEEFDSCRVTNPRPKIVAVCNKPERFMYFTITFRSFSPTPGGLEFKPGHTYYLISTSTARDIHRRAGGYCSTHNMKMVFNVADNAQETTINSRREEEEILGEESSTLAYEAKGSSGGSYLSNSPLLKSLRAGDDNLADPASTPSSSSSSSIPVYYYRSKTPAIHSSDYIYYYSPRDLVQLKLKAKKHDKSIRIDENETYRAQRLTSGSSSSRSYSGQLASVSALLLLLTTALFL